MSTTPKDIVLQLGALVALYVSISFFLTLAFGLTNVTFPIVSDSYWEIESATNSIRLGIAILLVFFPTYLILTRLVQQSRRHEDVAYQNIARWLVYLSLLVGGFVLLITLVTTIYTFLNGDITTRFVLKAGTVAIVMAGAFYYYLYDLKGYWVTHEAKSKICGGIASVFVLLAIVLGFMNIETPQAVREMRLDSQQLNDLRNIQWQIESYLATSTTTPESLEVVYAETGGVIPTAPEGREAYSYEITERGFQLCATFSRDANQSDVGYFDPAVRIKQSENWHYKVGRHCFDRVVQ